MSSCWQHSVPSVFSQTVQMESLLIQSVPVIQKDADLPHFVSRETGAPGGSRTPNLILRTDLLYPVELREHVS